MPKLVFSAKEIVNAFRYLDSDQIVAKVIIQIATEDFDNVSILHRKILATPKLYFDPSKSFLLIGGTELIGLEVADWMIRKGARKIIINSRKFSTTGYQAHCLHKWSQYERVKVEVAREDVTTLEGSLNLILKARQFGSVGGKY